MTYNPERIIIVVGQSRLQKLKKRFSTFGQAKFYVERQGVDFSDVQSEDSSLQGALENVQRVLSRQLKTKVVQRSFLPNYLFSEKDLVVVIGQDGLVANTAKYVKGLPIVAVNPEPDRFDGILLPFDLQNFRKGVETVINGRYQKKLVSMARAELNDGQSLIAFNDLFIGPKDHSSARYKLRFNRKEEQQSSSGIIISTGAGSTGWFSSLINMAQGITRQFASSTSLGNNRLDWAARKLYYVVREPFKSRMSGVELTAGEIQEGHILEIESLMSTGGVIFSDGIQSDFLEFNTGAIAKVKLASEQAQLVVP